MYHNLGLESSGLLVVANIRHVSSRFYPPRRPPITGNLLGSPFVEQGLVLLGYFARISLVKNTVPLLVRPVSYTHLTLPTIYSV